MGCPLWTAPYGLPPMGGPLWAAPYGRFSKDIAHRGQPIHIWAAPNELPPYQRNQGRPNKMSQGVFKTKFTLSMHIQIRPVFVSGTPAASGISADCFAYTRDNSGNFLASPIQRLLCSTPSNFICQLGTLLCNKQNKYFKNIIFQF